MRSSASDSEELELLAKDVFILLRLGANFFLFNAILVDTNVEDDGVGVVVVERVVEEVAAEMVVEAAAVVGGHEEGHEESIPVCRCTSFSGSNNDA